MRYQIKYADSLAVIYDKDPSWEELSIHFAKNGYDPLYVNKNGNLSYIVTFQDFSLGQINDSLNRRFIKKYSDNIKKTDIEKAFLEDLDAERIVFIKDKNVICEVNALIELPLQNSIAKNLMSLRYVNIFHHELSVYFKQFSSILILSEYEVYNYLQTFFADKNMIYAGCIEQAVSIVRDRQIDICFDFMFTKKIRRILAPELNNVLDLCKVLTAMAFEKLVDLASKRDVSLLFYKLPRFQDLSCFHRFEEENSYNRKTIGQLINNKPYMDLFTKEEKEKEYLRNKEFHASQRLDNGYCFIMDEAISPGINVHNGIRNNGHGKCEGSIVNIYGPCTAYGFLVRDEETVPNIIQHYAIEKGIKIQVHNRAGIHGDNELNSIMEALKKKKKKGDMHIFLDVLEDLTYDKYPQITFVKDWFNAEKSKEEVHFFDFPGHCNYDANKIMAKNIFDDLVNRYQCNEVEKDYRKPLLIDPFDSLANISISHASFVKQRRIFEKYSVHKNKKGSVAALVITGKEGIQIGEKLVDDCLLLCDFLYIFFINAEIENLNDNKYLYEYVHSLDSEKVIGIPLEYFFYAERYCITEDIRNECKEQIIFTQKAFFKLINDELGINTYFYHDSTKNLFFYDILTAVSKEQGSRIKIRKV